ncbi:MAG TPA: hypothetical protein VGO43_08765 [Pyrinomonadaceae bacterium]|jgi:hypothetical protein|nr:hypothetical protein [Pyrinomonadaceae bacterium]
MTTQATKTQQFTGGPTAAQKGIIHELCSKFELIDPSQISFDGDDTTPIFDYEANSILSIELTDIKHLDCEIVDRDIAQAEIGDFTGTRCTAKCTVTLPDGRTRSVTETAYVGEEINGRKLATVREADGIAQNRASRRGIRSVGVNLWNSILKFLRTGQKATGNTEIDPRNTFYSEIHVIAEEIGLIVNGDRSRYEEFIAEEFKGITSSSELDDQQIVVLRDLLRSVRRSMRLSQQVV